MYIQKRLAVVIAHHADGHAFGNTQPAPLVKICARLQPALRICAPRPPLPPGFAKGPSPVARNGERRGARATVRRAAAGAEDVRDAAASSQHECCMALSITATHKCSTFAQPAQHAPHIVPADKARGHQHLLLAGCDAEWLPAPSPFPHPRAARAGRRRRLPLYCTSCSSAISSAAGEWTPVPRPVPACARLLYMSVPATPRGACWLAAAAGHSSAVLDHHHALALAVLVVSHAHKGVHLLLWSGGVGERREGGGARKQALRFDRTAARGRRM